MRSWLKKIAKHWLQFPIFRLIWQAEIVRKCILQWLCIKQEELNGIPPGLILGSEL